MKRLILLWIGLAITVIFLVVPHEGEVHFKYSDVVLSKKQWAQDFFDHVFEAILGFVIFLLVRKYERKYATSAAVLVCILIADCVDYALTYGDPWMKGPITFNTLKISIFAVSIAYDYVNNRHVGIHQ